MANDKIVTHAPPVLCGASIRALIEARGIKTGGSTFEELAKLHKRWMDIQREIESLDDQAVGVEFQRQLNAASAKLIRGEAAPELADLDPGWIAKSWKARRAALGKVQENITIHAAPIATKYIRNLLSQLRSALSELRKRDTDAAKSIGLKEGFDSIPTAFVQEVVSFIEVREGYAATFDPERHGLPSPASLIRDSLGFDNNDFL